MYINQNAESAFKQIFNSFNAHFDNVNEDDQYNQWRIAEFIGSIVGGKVSLIGVNQSEESLKSVLKVMRDFLDELNEVSTFKIDEAYSRAKDVIQRRHEAFYRGVNVYIDTDQYVNTSGLKNPFQNVSLRDVQDFCSKFAEIFVACGMGLINHEEAIKAEIVERQSRTGHTARDGREQVRS